MDIDLSEEQQMLRRTARNFFEKELPRQLIKELEKGKEGFSPPLFRKMADLGWMGLIFPEEFGGSGGTLLDLALLMEEMGRVCYQGPYFSTVLSGLCIQEAGNEEQKGSFLPRISSGEWILTIAHSESAPLYSPFLISTRGKESGTGYCLQGTKVFVENAHVSHWMIVVAQTHEDGREGEDLTLFCVDPKNRGISLLPLHTLSGERQFQVVFHEAQVPRDYILGQVHQGGNPLRFVFRAGKVLKCAEMAGGAQRVLEMAVQYAKERVQFGRSIGSFQAIQHLFADMAIEIDGARYVTYRAAWEATKNAGDETLAAMAKAWASEAYQRTCARAHEIFGAIGFTEEHDLHFFTRKAKAYDCAFGDPRFQREVVAQNLGL